MSNGNTVATLASVQEKVRERIQATFVDLIPEELWAGMVHAQIEEITKTVLPKLVHEEAEKKLREMIQAEMRKPEWSEFWDDQSVRLGPRASAMVTEAVKKAAPDLVAALFGRFAQSIVSDLRNNIQRF